MFEPSSRKSNRPPFAPGQQFPPPGSSPNGTQQVDGGPSISHAGTSHNSFYPKSTTGTLNGGRPGYNPVPTQPPQAPYSAHGSQNFSSWNNGNAPRTGFPSSAQNMGPGSNWASVATQQAQKKRLIDKARDKYSRLSQKGKILLVVLLVAILIPSFATIFEGINALVLYSQVRSGMGHLQAAQAAFSGGAHGDMSKYADVNKLRQAQQEIDDAHSDFAQLRDELDQDGFLSMVGTMLPSQITTVRSLAHIGADATELAQPLLKTAIKLAPTLAPALKSAQGGDETAPRPYLNQAAYNEFISTINASAPLIHDMAMQAKGVSLDGLPLSDNQQKLISSILPLLPIIDAGLGQGNTLTGPLGWILGVDQQRTFLVEPMDRGELRATGGFTGQFGELAINGGHMSPLKLKNIGPYEEDLSFEGTPVDPVFYKVAGQSAPAPYTWWPVINFGMRDANLSADFPTSAKIIMDRYNYEFGKQLDGVIVFTPFLIEHVLHVTGPITVPDYNETIDEHNLESRLHYYQLDNVGIRKEEIVEHQEDPQLARKLFTQKVTKTLMSTAQHLPPGKLVDLVKEMLYSMKTKDLQAYFADQQVEDLVGKYGSTAAMDRSNNHDGFFLVQSNISASKASQYVSTSIKDTITLDADGGATHNMQLTLDYQQKGDVYGFDTYRDYLRMYVPTNSQLLSGNGFANMLGNPVCGDADVGYHPCAKDVFGDGTLVCSSTPVIGNATLLSHDRYALHTHPLTPVGEPTNTQSDEDGRDMYAGWAVIPKDCTLKVTLSWSVPPMGHHPYSLLVQRQASIFQQTDLTIKPAPGTCSASSESDLHFSGMMDGPNVMYTLNQQGSSCKLQATS